MRLLGLLIVLFLSNSLRAQSLADSVIRKYANDAHNVDSLLRIAASIQNKDYANCTRLCDEVIAIARASKSRSSYKASPPLFSMVFKSSILPNFSLGKDLKQKLIILSFKYEYSFDI